MRIISKMLVDALALAVINVHAAELMTKAELEEAESRYERIDDISANDEMSIVDAKEDLIEKADKRGVDMLVLTSSQAGSKIHGTANIHEKKQS